MIDILTGLTPILLVDIVNPVLFGFMVVAAGTSRPIVLSGSLLLGHTIVLEEVEESAGTSPICI